MDYYEEFLDPDEEFERQFAEEEEMLNEYAAMIDEETQPPPPKKSLKFDNMPVSKTTRTPKNHSSGNGLSSVPVNRTPNLEDLPSTSSGIYHAEDLQPLMSQKSFMNGTPRISQLNGHSHFDITSPPLMDLEESFKDVGNTKIVVNENHSKSSNKRTARDSVDVNLSTSSSKRPAKNLFDLNRSSSSSRKSLKSANKDSLDANHSTSSSRTANDLFDVNLSTNSSKRTAEDLFGDINDIDFNEDLDLFAFGSVPKKKKTNDIDERDALMIAKIIEERKKRASINAFQDFSNETGFKKKSECVLVRRVPKYNFMTLRNGKGEKFYTKLHSDEALSTKIVSVSEECKNTRLLSIPFETVMNDANAIIAKKLETEMNTPPKERSVVNPSKSVDTDLWVEKYKPMSYIDLLSDEGTNRILLQWVKLWDKVVFGREKRIRIKDNKPKFESKFQRKNFLVLDEELDDSGCPKFKLVLLCGPPGLGKTTLAHVVARHAGYNPVEMNASDDRSPDVFRQQLEAATQMRSVIGTSPRPNCLIIDEIDGAPSASIDVLVKFAKNDGKKQPKKKGAKLTGLLKRPIICICNDVYVAALRPLRQMALVIHFPPTSLQRLTQRLLDITQREKIKTDLSAMMALCEKASNDIRTCLSTIYCLKDRAIKTSTISQANIGSKDMQKGLFTVWRDIFQIQTTTSTIREELKKDSRRMETDLILSRRLHSVLSSVQGNGDYDRLAQGVYENFLNVKTRNFTMNNVSKSLQWFCFFDQIKTTIASTQMYTLMTYMPYCFVTWHFLCANYLSSKLNYPSLLFELMTRQLKYQQIVHEVLKGMEPKVRAYSHYEQLLLDNLPYFTHLLNPSIRPVSLQLFSTAEKVALQQLVHTMIDYNLNFVQERTPDGSYQFILDPNIEDVVEFPDIQTSKRLSYSLKMTISREVDQEKIRRLESSLLKNATTLNAPAILPPIEVDLPVNENSPQSKTQEEKKNHLQKLTPKMIKKTTSSSITKDFFGRIVERSAIEKKKLTKVDEIVKSDVWYHFKEGFSNAVRRSVHMKDLLQK